MIRVTRAPKSCLLSLLVTVALCAACGSKNRPIAPLDPIEEATTSPSTPPDEPVVGDLISPQLDVEVEPASVIQGESADLRWTSADAQEVRILPDIGEVGLSGTLRVFPEETTRYLVRARGSGGSVEKGVEVRVSPSSAVVRSEDLSPRFDERFSRAVKPVFFAFDSWELSPKAKVTLDENFDWLERLENSNLQVLIEGHCDARGTEEYNLALGDRRARTVQEYLQAKGLASDRLRTLSLGEERPLVLGDSEEAYAGNRRAHFVLINWEE